MTGPDYTHMTPPPPPAATVQTLADVPAERVAWLWPGRLPLGKLVVLDGDPATGKSTLTLDLGARVSTGARWPDGVPATSPAGVLLLSAEDGLADTLVPRLIAAGADLRRVHALTDVPSVDEDGEVRHVPPSLPRDLAVIEKVVTEKTIKLVVVDVLMAYLSGKVDSHRDQDVRGVLHQLGAMAERTGATVVLVRHLNKAGGTNALYRGGGSIGIVGAARAAYLVARDPEDADRRILAVTKSNLSVEPPSLAYRLVDDPTNGCARVQWEDGPVDHTAASLLRDATDDETRTERDEAVDWLTGYLKANGGQAPRKDVMKAAAAERFSERTLKRAAARAGVVSERYGYPAVATWSLPVGPPRPNTYSLAQLEAVAQLGLTWASTPTRPHSWASWATPQVAAQLSRLTTETVTPAGSSASSRAPRPTAVTRRRRRRQPASVRSASRPSTPPRAAAPAPRGPRDHDPCPGRRDAPSPPHRSDRTALPIGRTRDRIPPTAGRCGWCGAPAGPVDGTPVLRVDHTDSCPTTELLPWSSAVTPPPRHEAPQGRVKVVNEAPDLLGPY
jgi:hypothetical protein